MRHFSSPLTEVEKSKGFGLGLSVSIPPSALVLDHGSG